MKFSVGDIVKVRQTDEEGQVVEITHDGYVRVRFQQQVIPIEEAALDFPYLDWFLKQREEDKKTKKKLMDEIDNY